MKEVQWIDPDFLAPKDAWDRLSMKEKAAMMKVAVQNGITNLSDIRAKYNEFAEGGDLEGSIVKDNVGYSEWVNSLPDNLKHTDPALYDMLGAYKAGMQPTLEKDGLYHLQSRDPRTGRILKSSIHPTYLQAIATDTSLGYFPIVDDKGNTYTETWEGNTLFQPEDNEYRGPIVEEVNVNANGGNLFRGGGYKPSTSVKKRISTWEGAAMTGAKDPLSGKWGKNRSFEAEASSFYAALPASIREQVLSNPKLADNLFSYSYNVGAGNFKKRVVPALERYYSGMGSAKEIASSMWASGDKKLRGLRNRRAIEKNGVLNALTPNMPVDNTFVYNPYFLQEQNTTMLPQVVPDENAYVSTHEVSPEEIKAQRLQESFDNINRFNRTMEMLGNNLRIPTFHPTTGNDVLDLLWSTRGNDSPLLQMADEYARGGKIHIKPSHRGRLTELKKRTGKSEAELYRTGSPATRKMITFARNARKWKHGLGGNLYDGESEESQQMETMLSPHVELAYTNPWLYSKLHPAKDRDEEYKPTTFAGRVSQAAGGDDLTQKYVDYTSSVIQQVPGIGIIPSALDLGYDVNRMYHNPSINTTKDVALDAASLLPALKKTMKGWWMKGNSGTFVAENGQTFINPRVASALEVALQPYRTAVNTGIYAGRAADFIDDSKAFLKDMYNDSPIGKHFPIKALGGNLFDGTTQPSQKIKIGKPYYSYDENGRKIDDTLNYNISFPEIVITPDSRKSPAERAILERERRRAHDAYFGNGTYNAKLDKEQTELEKAASNNVWKNSFEGKFLDKGKSITSGVKTAAGFIPVTGDIIQGLDATKDAVSGDYLSAGLGLGMLAVPNLIEKPLKYLGKGIKSVFELTDNQWDEMYNAAIKANDVEEAQRLRDLHFMAKAPDTAIANEGLPIHAYHGTGKQFNEFDTTGKYSTLDEGYYGVGAYFAPNKEIADMYADTERTPIVYDTYLNIKDPLRHVRDENADLYGKPIVGNDGVISTLPDDLIDPDFDMTEFVATKPNQIKRADVVTYDDAGNIIPLSQRDNFSNSDIRYFKDDFGKDILLTPYPGTDAQLIDAANNGHLAALRHQFSKDKAEQLKAVMGWDDAALSEYQNEILKSFGSAADVQVKGVEDGFKQIGSHAGKVHEGGSVSHNMTLNRDRIPNDEMAIEAGIHEMGAHGRTLSMNPSEIGIEGSSSNTNAQMFPRIAEVMQKNREIAKEVLVPNDKGKALQQMKNSADLEIWLDKNKIPADQWDDYFKDWRYYKYATSDQELLARGYTGQVYETIDPSIETLNIQQLKRFFTPESVEKYKKAVLSTLPFVSTGTAVGLSSNEHALGGKVKKRER